MIEEFHISFAPHSRHLRFYWFDSIKERLAGLTLIEADDLRNELTSIPPGLSEDEKS
jgi:hypothetical protein